MNEIYLALTLGNAAFIFLNYRWAKQQHNFKWRAWYYFGFILSTTATFFMSYAFLTR